MTLHLLPSDTVQDIQKKFTERYSHLRPEFFKKFHKESNEYLKKEQYLHNITLSEMLGHQEEVIIPIDKNMTTEAFEAYFENEYQLHVQLMRLQKDSWLMTTQTQHLTLGEQNQKGIEADNEIAPTSIKDMDVE